MTRMGVAKLLVASSGSQALYTHGVACKIYVKLHIYFYIGACQTRFQILRGLFLSCDFAAQPFIFQILPC